MAASIFCPFLKSLFFANIFIVVILVLSTRHSTAASSSGGGSCFTSIISFGDSLADTGNLLRLSSGSNSRPDFGYLPYGETFFHSPTGRCSNGRLIIDFLAQYLGLRLIPPYVGGRIANGSNFPGGGVNFAVAGATVLDSEFFLERGIINPFTNVSLGTEMGWFRKLLPSLCQTPSDCNELLHSSLVLMGEIGGNDYNYAFLNRRSLAEVQTFVSPIIDAIASAINEIIDLGVVTVMVPGNLPIGCSTAYLTVYESSNPEDYDTETGCLIWLNDFAEYHNQQLQIALNRIRELHPHATVIYSDYYNAAMQFFRSPKELGFEKALSACCGGGGGSYNYNPRVTCGSPHSTVCEDPSLYVNWDGVHLTEAAYKWMFKGLFQGQYTTPQFNSLFTASEVGSTTESAEL